MTSNSKESIRKRPSSVESLDRMYTFSLRKQGKKKEETKIQKPLGIKSDLKLDMKIDIGNLNVEPRAVEGGSR